jgi:hypothetical protein
MVSSSLNSDRGVFRFVFRGSGGNAYPLDLAFIINITPIYTDSVDHNQQILDGGHQAEKNIRCVLKCTSFLSLSWIFCLPSMTEKINLGAGAASV